MGAITKLLVVAFLLRFILSFITWHPDINNHIDWGIRFWDYGPGKFYKANVWSFDWPNQPPGTIIIFALARRLYEVVFAVFWWLNITIPPFPSNLMLFFEERLYPVFLKLPSILADLGIGFLIYRYFANQKKIRQGIIGAGIFLFNPAVWYNSSLWGQTDSIVNLFGLLSILSLINKRIALTLVFIGLSLFIKASLIALLPVIFIILAGQKYSFSDWKRAILAVVIVLGILTLPFSQGEPFSWLFNLYQQKIFGNRLELITANAFNFWAAFTGIHARSHELFLGPFPFKIWGTLLFSASLVPIFILVAKKQNTNIILWSCFLTLFSSFVFLTGMHERYLYPIFPVLTLIAVQSLRNFVFLVLVSVIHLLNLYNFWWYPKFDVLVTFLSIFDRISPRILGAVNTVLFFLVYFDFLRKEKLYGSR